nr:MAG TPA_asm: hypothetical protein [Caudoviricetes sp.]
MFKIQSSYILNTILILPLYTTLALLSLYVFLFSNYIYFATQIKKTSYTS